MDNERFEDTQPAVLDWDTPLSPTQALTQKFDVMHTHHAPSTAGGVSGHAAGATAAAQQVRQGFRIGDLGLMIRYEHGSELTEMPPVVRLPNAPDWFAGVANLHGTLTPVFDLARYADVSMDYGIAATPGAPAAYDQRPMLLVLLHGADAAGIVINGLPRRLRFTPGDASASQTTPPRLASHIRAAALIDGQWWFDLDCASLLRSLESDLEPSH
jgi:twitching motility protein PilI